MNFMIVNGVMIPYGAGGGAEMSDLFGAVEILGWVFFVALISLAVFIVATLPVAP